jgi:hypothetical protein
MTEQEGATMKEEDFLAAIQSMLDRSGMTADDTSFVIASLWTHDQLPEIESQEQYLEYGKRQDHLEQSSLPLRSDPGWDQAFAEFCRTPVGMLASSYGARMIEWEERQEERVVAEEEREAEEEENEECFGKP